MRSCECLLGTAMELLRPPRSSTRRCTPCTPSHSRRPGTCRRRTSGTLRDRARGCKCPVRMVSRRRFQRGRTCRRRTRCSPTRSPSSRPPASSYRQGTAAPPPHPPRSSTRRCTPCTPSRPRRPGTCQRRTSSTPPAPAGCCTSPPSRRLPRRTPQSMRSPPDTTRTGRRST